jgi:hypothetical protein
MTKITLELENSADETLLFALLQRMGIAFSTSKREQLSNKQFDYHRGIIEKGVDIKNIDVFIQYFNESRKDRPLPFENQ